MALRFNHCSVLALITLWFSLNHYSLNRAYAHESTVIASFNIPPYQPSACYRYTDQGVMITAVSDDLWNDGAACGETYPVTCVSGMNLGTPEPCYGTTTTVMVVDYCPNGCSGRTFDLSQEAFAAIADTDSGLINVSYQ